MNPSIDGVRRWTAGLGLLAFIATFPTGSVLAAGKGHSSDLKIARDSVTGKVTVSWNGNGVLKQSSSLNSRFKPAKARGGSHTAIPDSDLMLYTVESAGGAVYSVNIVGYVNLSFPPGLSLVANPLYAIDHSLEALISPPDGSQVMVFVPALGTYEVSTFDGITGAWSNPDIELPPGAGFFFNNNTPNPFVQTFVGEVHTGTLVNNIPAGFSLKGALVPQAGSINTLQNIPGRPGDRLLFHVNGAPEGSEYIVCEYLNGWVPDVTLQVAQGFIAQMTEPISWVRVFTIGP